MSCVSVVGELVMMSAGCCCGDCAGVTCSDLTLGRSFLPIVVGHGSVVGVVCCFAGRGVPGGGDGGRGFGDEVGSVVEAAVVEGAEIVEGAEVDGALVDASVDMLSSCCLSLSRSIVVSDGCCGIGVVLSTQGVDCTSGKLEACAHELLSGSPSFVFAL